MTGRQWGKTILSCARLKKEAFHNPGMYLYCFPSKAHAKRVAWDKLKAIMLEHPKDLPRDWKNEQELFVRNIRGGVIMLCESFNTDKIRGFTLKGAILDEYQLYKEA